MLELKDAYEILGVKKGASKDEIIKRYDILLKIYKINKADGAGSEAQVMDNVTEAYNILMGYGLKDLDGGRLEAEINKPPSRFFQKIGLDEKKTKNFFYYYKVHMIVGIIVLSLAISMVYSIVTRVIPDLNLTFVGEIYVQDSDILKKNLIGNLQGVKEIGLDTIPVSKDGKGQQDYALQMKVMTIMAAGDVDIFIMDKVNFEKFGKQGAFMSLDDLVPQLGIDIEKNKSYVFKTDSVQGEHLYGVDVSGSSFLKGPNVIGKEQIAAIRTNAKNYEKAVNLLKLLVKGR